MEGEGEELQKNVYMLLRIVDNALSFMWLVSLKDSNIRNKHNMFKSLNWREADQLALYKHDRGVGVGSTEKQPQPSGQSWT